MSIDTSAERYSVLFDRLLSKAKLQSALQVVLQIDPTQIEVATIPEWNNPEVWEQDKQVFCMMNEFLGDFPSTINIIFEPEIRENLDFHHFCHQMNRHLKTSCLVDDDTLGIPYHCLLAKEDKLYEVRLNAEYLDAARSIFVLEEVLREYSKP